ncbi:ABC transporter ATP-binding protein [Alicyclobacillus fodiniaquatilis]|uniref:ABC transporter ATP-binding protein n=1 Tax=Alicyclobacillus fodiniaquatilis TaxID=1661150 RepID=A0ABW4JEV5_9BACL
MPETMLSVSSKVLVELKGITKSFPIPKGALIACQDINLVIEKGRSVGLVGESGSGKSTVMRVLQLLLPATSGEVWMNGVNVSRLPQRRLKRYRRNVQFVAQDPFGSLFPHYTVGGNIAEPLRIHQTGTKSEQSARALELMASVGLSQDLYYKFPHELSGGQQQRVAIARALALSPELLVLDEAVSSLDVSIQAQILNLLQEMKARMGLTYAFISHNLAAVRLLCEDTVVMYLGRIVESAPSEVLFKQPIHPYTKSLIDAIPAFVGDKVKSLPTGSLTKVERPSPTHRPSGCAYHTRCPFATDVCKVEEPKWTEPLPGHRVACHHADRLK